MTVTKEYKTAVIIPAFNARPFIEGCLRSVLSQNANVVAVIIVDDGSTDGTADLVNGTHDPFRQITLIRQCNQGISAARNAGFNALSKDVDIVMFLDQDDELVTGALARLLTALDEEAGPAAVAVFGRATAIDSSGASLNSNKYWGGTRQFYKRFRLYTKENLGDITPDDLLCANCIFSPGQAIIRRKSVEAIGGFDAKVTPSEDWDLWYQLSKTGPIRGIDIPVLRYRIHTTNFSANRRRMQIAGLRLRLKWIKGARLRLKLKVIVAYCYRLLDRSGVGLLSSSRQ